MKNINDVPILFRREIEAMILAKVYSKLIEKIGQAKAIDLLAEVVASDAIEFGIKCSSNLGENSLESVKKLMESFKSSDALTIEYIEQPNCLLMNVSRCAYAEMYKRLGLSELGFVLSCGRDYWLMKGFNPSILFSRTQTIMQGDYLCDFKFCMDESEQVAK